MRGNANSGARNTGEVLETLRNLGKPQTAEIYKRYGSGDQVFGVLTSEIAKLKKKIGIDHAFALDLWNTGHAEARILALLVADPDRLTPADADRFVTEGPVQFLGWYLSDLLAHSPIGEETMQAWMESRDEHRLEMAYGIFGKRLKGFPDATPDDEAEKRLEKIEREIHHAPNWVRYAMNGALIAIGTYKPHLRETAMQTARRIGKVIVDHGETSCKTPDAVAHLTKASMRKRRR